MIVLSDIRHNRGVDVLQMYHIIISKNAQTINHFVFRVNWRIIRGNTGGRPGKTHEFL